MFVEPAFRASGEPPRKTGPEIPSSKGYPAVQDLQAHSPKGILSDNLSDASIRRLRQKYTCNPCG